MTCTSSLDFETLNKDGFHYFKHSISTESGFSGTPLIIQPK